MTITEWSARRERASAKATRRGRTSHKAWRWVTILGALAGLAGARPAEAQSEEKLDRARMSEQMHAYFHGEKREAPFFLGAGLVGMGAGAVMVSRDSEAVRGAAFPLLGIGLIQAIIGGVLLLNTDRRVRRLDEQMAKAPAALKREEAQRLVGVKTSFIGLMLAEAVMLVGGVTMAAVASSKECCRTLQGIGFGLAVEGWLSFVLDRFAYTRALEYAHALDRFEPKSSASFVPRESTPPRVGPLPFRSPF